MTQWSDFDHSAVGAAPLDPAFQAAWEAYGLLVAVFTWREDLAGDQGPLTLHGDAQGVLQVVIAHRAKNALLDKIVAEIERVLGATSHCWTAVHFWCEENAVCDALSRAEVGAELPKTHPRRRGPWRFWCHDMFD